ncbi:DUF2934 domain-containing protein [Sulfuricystis multivorans]|uniref:DUF2934 domain-containing protein n=1 Tax=Sulfuricystis multivorans TaxID=2211108 RepID=UPI0024DF3DBB|nr:DUF2934 domain-containing protein [Sulfuricystis multivorans]
MTETDLDAAHASKRPVTPEERYKMIAEAAYFLAEKRGFAGGDMAQDWRNAEAQIDQMLREQGRLPALTDEDIEQRVKTALASDPASIAKEVRAITLDALTRGHLDSEAVKRVTAAVVAGARAGVAPLGERGDQPLKEAMRGLDEALAGAAEAAHLAIEEAATRTKEFSQQGLKKAADDLATLQTLFAETLQEAARTARGVAQTTFKQLAEHAKSSGSAVGQRVKLAVEQLAQTAKATARDQARKGTKALRNETALLAGLAAGLLQGIAARLQSTSDEKQR